MKNDPFNIFDEAARRSSGIKKKAPLDKKVESSSAKTEMEKAPSPQVEKQLERKESVMLKTEHKKVVAPSLTVSGLSEEFQEQLAIAKLHHEELTTRLDEIQNKMGMSLTEMKEYLNNSKNFKPFEWQFIQTRRAVLQEKILNLIGVEGRALLKKTEVAKNVKERKGKTLGSRKKWISMQ